MILVTGDIHGPTDIAKLSAKSNTIEKQMTKEDFLIICGDFGMVWDNSEEDMWWRKWLDKKPYTTLFIDGNHENFDLLEKFNEVNFCGGKAHRISESIYHLMRGEMFTLQGKKFFAMGGAESHDKEYRTEGESWWRQELPSKEEYSHALDTLKRNDFRTDHVLTHCAPSCYQSRIAEKIGLPYEYPANELTDFLEDLLHLTAPEKWFCGHYHTDLTLTDDFEVLFERIIRIV